MLDVLRRIVQKVSAAPNLDQALNLLVKDVCQAMQTTVCSVYLTHKINDQQELVLMATEGLNAKAIGVVRLSFDEGLVGLVAQRAEPINLDNAPAHPRYKYFPEASEETLRSFLGVPIINYGKLLGVLVVQQLEQRRFDDDHVAFLITLAAQLAGAIAQAGISEDFRRLQSSGSFEQQYLEGLPGSPGVAIGTAVVVYSPADLDSVPDRHVADVASEIERFHAAVRSVHQEMQKIGDAMREVLPAEECAMFDAFAMMLESGSLLDDTVKRIEAGNWAPAALRDTIKEHTAWFGEMSDSYLSERADDIVDLGRRVAGKLLSADTNTKVWEYPEKTILVGEQLSASQLAEVPREKLVAVVSVHGSGSSHIAILAAALQVPAVMGVSDLPVSQIEGEELIVDGYAARVYVHPDKTIKKEYRRLLKEERELSAELQELVDLPAETSDGVQVSLFANTGLQSDINPALIKQADGIGLFRTEVPFQIRDKFPGEDEQEAIYKQALQAFAPRPVVIRTLDIGGDKALSYFPVKEENPFLGWRGIRISLDHPDIFITQIRAMLKANRGLNNLHILLPMISGMIELRQAMALILRAHRELLEEGLVMPLPPIGLMIEVPSSVYMIGSFAKYVNFLSIGSNDLTQYLLAVDRNNERVGKLYDALHPAVLHAISQVIKSAEQHNKPVSICGELAGDPLGALLLLGMGMKSFSMSAGSLLRVKKIIRTFSYAQAVEITARAVLMEDAQSVRALLINELDHAGLGGLIRAGKN
ncbi:MAG: phosphoenolpyruvate--protein phosphotransferase [Gammaproteobacteria bacterium]|nr:phosphoenolpyruvate--protein phosphotransferase [Gammaproteobacteria bacterium]